MTVITNSKVQPSQWRTVVLLTLAFWLSSSFLLDFVIMPTLYATGMITEPGFASAGYSLFWMFNRIELLCAALVLTGVLLLRSAATTVHAFDRWVFPLALGLLSIALIYTYALTPEMSALGLHLNLFDSASTTPAGMNRMHGEYWVLESLKFLGGVALLGFCYRNHETA